MTTSVSKTNRQGENIALLLISSVLITLFLFFIDEGYYNFDWMLSAFNWIPFFIYAFCIFTAQLIISVLILSKYGGKGKEAISVIVGTALALAFLIGVVF
ncbi:hypothetical protein R9C00_02955 [Flammeovirgaceae bacterium SG7u.111]|nr:hypothetical protein [Flammeovirgaceae bacterium SG7u.132]WPO36400.1 hypothetical protein R9C00_02955 [Flammeovirgaceae bacterium SG7u.111]